MGQWTHSPVSIQVSIFILLINLEWTNKPLLQELEQEAPLFPYGRNKWQSKGNAQGKWSTERTRRTREGEEKDTM